MHVGNFPHQPGCAGKGRTILQRCAAAGSSRVAGSPISSADVRAGRCGQFAAAYFFRVFSSRRCVRVRFRGEN